MRQPVMFISHGAPTLALETSGPACLLRECGDHFQSCRAVVILSPHWMTQQLVVNSNPAPSLIYDFGGFPAALYQVQYAAQGDPDVAQQVIAQLQEQHFSVREEVSRGWDHGVWTPLVHLLPAANIPLIQISLPTRFQPADLFRLGAALSPLRDQGIAVVGSGSLTHNLYAIRFGAKTVAQEVKTFEAWVTDQIEQRTEQNLLQADTQFSQFAAVHPTDEHYLPLLFAYGATNAEDTLTILKPDVEHHALSMRSFLWTARS